jgi:pyrimidine-nucleoside phosphorylase
MLTRDSSDEDVADVIGDIALNHHRDPNVAAELAMTFAQSGERLSLNGTVTADVASTGGPSSLSTLLCPLFLRTAGAVVPKLGIEGRPAGGIDSLAQIPNYRTELAIDRIESILRNEGYAHFLGGTSITPLDTRVFRIRQKIGFQAVPTLVAASLLAKKIAVGVKFAGLDVRVSPHGNFGRNREEATLNAKLFIQAARNVGIEATPVLTPGSLPYQPYIARKDSIAAVYLALSGNDAPWLRRHVDLCRSLSVAVLPERLRAAARHATLDDLKKRFDENLRAQSATWGDFERAAEECQKSKRIAVRVVRDGYCSYDLLKLRDAMVGWQRRHTDSPLRFPDPVGVVLMRQPGVWVTKGEEVAAVRVEGLEPREVATALGAFLQEPSAESIGFDFEVVYG